MPISASPPRRWDIFCRVVDNFGDIGVCWRLARQLLAEHGREVRLWVDDLASLAPLQPGVQVDLDQQQVAGVDVRRWRVPFPKVKAADIVVEAFACELPEDYLEAMAAATKPPGWINLEYLSAEPWVESCHGVASPHPALPLIKYFFFPGFSAKTSGLLREADLLTERDAFLQTLAPRDALQISLFCYDTAPVGKLLTAWAASERPIHCRVAAGKAATSVEAYFGHAGPWQLGNLTLEPVAFLPQPAYDRLLWECDLNFVRGEDSFVRAQWAGKPFVWQTYPQDDAAHLEKLEAFLARYTDALAPAAAQATRALFRAWNHPQGEGLADAWGAYAAHLPLLQQHGMRWERELLALGNLAENLVKFCTYDI